MKSAKVLFWAIFAIWIGGALIFAAKMEVQRKADCIRSSGVIKGWLWCDTDESGRFFGVEFTKNIWLGLRWPAGLWASERQVYRSKEFNDPDSRIPTVFVCMFAGDNTGLAPDAPRVLMEVLVGAGVTPEKFDLWAQDADIYLTSELAGKDLARYWTDNCEGPIEMFRQGVSRD